MDESDRKSLYQLWEDSYALQSKYQAFVGTRYKELKEKSKGCPSNLSEDELRDFRDFHYLLGTVMFSSGDKYWRDKKLEEYDNARFEILLNKCNGNLFVLSKSERDEYLRLIRNSTVLNRQDWQKSQLKKAIEEMYDKCKGNLAALNEGPLWEFRGLVCSTKAYLDDECLYSFSEFNATREQLAQFDIARFKLLHEKCKGNLVLLTNKERDEYLYVIRTYSKSKELYLDTARKAFNNLLEKCQEDLSRLTPKELIECIGLVIGLGAFSEFLEASRKIEQYSKDKYFKYHAKCRGNINKLKKEEKEFYLCAVEMYYPDYFSQMKSKLLAPPARSTKGKRKV